MQDNVEKFCSEFLKSILPSATFRMQVILSSTKTEMEIDIQSENFGIVDECTLRYEIMRDWKKNNSSMKMDELCRG